MKIICLLLSTIIGSLIYSQTNNALSINYGENGSLVIAVNPQFHINYGLSYPITYEIILESNESFLFAYHKHNRNSNWQLIEEKTSNDFFNAIEAVRFDYANSKAFVSVAFDEYSDSLFIKITDSDSNNIPVIYNKICMYYDNRNAVVTTTADDLSQYDNGGFQKAFTEFRKRKLWLSCGAITGNFNLEAWQNLQLQIDSGYVEIDAHSRTHVHYPYPDVNSEVVGSRDDIKNNLELPPLYRKGDIEYVYSYIYPYGNWSSTIDRVAGENGYIINRTVRINECEYTDWNSDLNIFNRVGAVYEVGAVYDGVNGISDINVLMNKFDEIVENNQIYHFTIHPKHIEEHGDWELPYITEHLDYISGHKDIWYVGFGHLYLYNLIKCNDVEPINAQIDLKVFLEGCYLDNSSMSTSLNSHLPISQPYSAEPWNSNSNECVEYSSNENVVDWVLVSLYKDIDGNNPNPETAVKTISKPALLRQDGKIVDLDGESFFSISTFPGEYYIKIEHRTHIPVMSSQTVNLE